MLLGPLFSTLEMNELMDGHFSFVSNPPYYYITRTILAQLMAENHKFLLKILTNIYNNFLDISY